MSQPLTGPAYEYAHGVQSWGGQARSAGRVDPMIVLRDA
jgi:hypothetical protein